MSHYDIARQSEGWAVRANNNHLRFSRQFLEKLLNGQTGVGPLALWSLTKILEKPWHEAAQTAGYGGLQITLDQIHISPPPVAATAIVHGRDQAYSYPVNLRGNFDLNRVQVFQNWWDPFDCRPGGLVRHFRRVAAKLYGYVDDDSGAPFIPRSRSIVALDTRRRSISLGEGSVQQQIWFIMTREGDYQCGLCKREGNHLLFIRPNDAGNPRETYLLRNVELIGCATGRVLLHLSPKHEPGVGAVLCDPAVPATVPALGLSPTSALMPSSL